MSNISEATNPDKRQRFSVYVPNPSASFQLGAADYANGFGYNGGALSVDPCLFIDVNKHTLFQSGTHSCWQVGGKWLQYANGPMYMTSLEHTTVGAGLKMLLVAGAAQGQITALVHRKDGTPRIVEYNNLTTRYRVEEQANNVVRFLHGRKTLKDMDGAPGAAVDGPRGMKTGMIAASKATTTALALGPDLLDEMDDEKGRAHFRAYYPYAKKSDLPPLKQLFWLLNKMTRFRDVLQKYLWWITDNALVASVTKVLEAANHMFSVYHNLQLFINGVVMDFASKNNSETGAREWGWDDNRFAREATGADGQGWGARLKHAQSTHEKFYAKVTSGSGPFDFTQRRSYVSLTVEYDSGSTVFSASNLPTSAQVTGTAPTTFAGKKWTAESVKMPKSDTAVATTLTLTIGSGANAPAVWVGFGSEETVTPSQMAAKINAADAAPKKLTVVDAGSTVYVYAADCSTPITTSWTTAPSSDFEAANILTGLAGLTFLLTVDHVLSSVTFAATDVSIDEVAGRINKATGHSDPAVATVAGGALTLQSLRSGKKRSNLNLVEQSAGVLAKIGLTATQAVGADGNPAVADWEAVTADEVKEHIATSGKDHMAVSGGSFQLKSNKHGVDSEVKQIAASSTSSVLGLSRKKDKIDGDDFNMTTPGDLIQGMRATVFELNKLPEDTRNILRPLIEAIDDLNGVVASTANMIDSLVGIVDLWKSGDRAPSPVAIVGRDGISLGTNDTLVGVASKGVCFYATGAAGVVDKREFIALLEKPLSSVPQIPKVNLFASIDNLTDLDPDDAFESNIGFQVRSATDAGLRSVHRAELLAVGRDDNGDGVGHALLGGSSSAEVCAEKTAALGARAEGGRVEILGERIAIGQPRAQLKGTEIKVTWDPTQVNKQVVTADVQAEAKAIASLGAGDFFLGITANGADNAFNARKAVLQQEKVAKTAAATAVQVQINAVISERVALATEMLALKAQNPGKDPNEIQGILDRKKQYNKLGIRKDRLTAYKDAIEVRGREIDAEIAQLQALIDKGMPGVLIAVRDPAEERVPAKDQPSLALSKAGITLRTSTQKAGDPQSGTKIDMGDDQVVITQGDKKYGIGVSKDGIVLKADDQKKILDITGNAVALAASTKVDFSMANKILLG